MGQLPTNIGQILTKRATLNPTIEALFDVAADRRLTFAELNSETNRVASLLSARGVKTGDRVGLLMMNSTEFVTTFFATAKLGAVIVPLNWRLVADELEFILKDSGVTALVFDADFAPVVADLQSRGTKTDVREWFYVGTTADKPSFAIDFKSEAAKMADTEPAITASDDDLLYIMYTSGTTGLPKGVMHSHNTQMWAILTVTASSDFANGDRYINPMPMFHVAALTPAIVAVYRGLTHVMMRAFDPMKTWELIDSENIASGLMVPAMLNFMRATYDPAKHKHQSLRWIMSGAAPVPVPLIQAYSEMGIDINQVYGLTETCGPACLTSPEDAIRKAGSTGKAFFHTEVRIVRGDGSDCGPNEPGEVIVRGDHIMLGYWNRPEATAETLVDGWLHTGDGAIMDEDGFVYIQDRIKDMIISGGENVYPAEIENVIMSNPGVGDVAVIGIPSQKWGESPLAIVVKKDPALTEADVLSHCEGKLARFKQPVAARFVDVIPRNPSGKALKKDLRVQFNDVTGP
ncbi:MAG: long-chain-fatty-acid--CoA ligase [Actinobacteria bacterium]|nr:long-chain-fatty-acid--CoA ligase [Actinomycetota bacterium]